ncbi:hypothetical protein COB18_02735 [Candidatus Kaiserbacteria bacterium]|nr:MAG: hypothetical protein COB18_02735 [Candidatus Kaiserbacteria bacterium]
MGDSVKKVHEMSLFLYFFLLVIALLLDSSLGLIPVLGALVGFVFSLIVSVQMYMFDFENGKFLRAVARFLGVFFLEFFTVVLPMNAVFVTLIFLANRWRIKKQEKEEEEMENQGNTST